MLVITVPESISSFCQSYWMMLILLSATQTSFDSI